MIKLFLKAKRFMQFYKLLFKHEAKYIQVMELITFVLFIPSYLFIL